jgi:hypothetical protein
MKNIFALLWILLSTNVLATPQKIEMIFLSPQKITKLLELIDQKNNSEKLLTLISQADNELKNCMPMGDGCFDPQLGYIEKKPDANLKSSVISIPKDPDLKLKTFNAVETSFIDCDKENYFDIFCGKEKAQGKPSEIEIWFDVSSSLKTVDYNKDPDQCNRRAFITKVMEGCKEKVRASIYNTSLKEVGEFSSVCLAYGTNDESKLLQWMKGSRAKTLILVTDVDEMSGALKEFLSENGAKMIGDGVRPFTSTDLVNYANDFIKTCKK